MKLQRISFAVVVAAGVCLHSLLAEQLPAPAGKLPRKGDSVVVRGCLVGPTIESVETVAADDTGRVAAALTYRLKGDKQVLKDLRGKYDGQQVEVTGVLKSTLPQDDELRGKTLGKTKVVFGVGTPSGQRNAPAPQAALPVLEVKSYEGSSARCAR